MNSIILKDQFQLSTTFCQEGLEWSLALWNWAHKEHCDTFSSIWDDIPGQNRTSRARCLHFTIPWCDSWMSSNISFLLLWGTMSFCALNNNPSISEISSLHDQSSRTANGSSCLWQGHPFRTTVHKAFRVGSAAVSCWNLLYLSCEMGRWAVSWTSFTSKSGMTLSLVSSKYALLSASAR